MATRARVVAFAYENPTFEEQLHATAAHQHVEEPAKPAPAPREDASVEIGPATADEDRDLERLIFPDTDGTFRRLTWQFWILQALIVAHVLLIAYTDPPPETNSVLVQTLIVSIQIGLIVVIMMAFFVFTSQTIFIRFGRYDKYLREYGAFYGIALLQLMMIAAVKVYYIVLFAQRMAPLEFMSNLVYFIIWVIQRCVLLAFWITATYQSTRVFRRRVYDPDYLLRM